MSQTADPLLHAVAEAISRCRAEHDAGGFGEPTPEALALTALEVALPLHYGREVTEPVHGLVLSEGRPAA